MVGDLMQITYHKGPSKNEYCKIHANRSEFVYDIDGIPRKSRNTPDERRDLILQIVARNNGIRHTHVIFLAEELAQMVKRTIEKELKRLEEDKLLESDKEGERYSNGPRKWSIKAPESEIEKQTKKETQNIIASLEEYIQTIEKKFEKLNQVEKDYAMANLLDILHSWQPIIEIINHDTRIKKEKKKFDFLVNQAYDILKHEKRDYIDGRPFLRRLLHLKASEPMVIMNNFLEEIK